MNAPAPRPRIVVKVGGSLYDLPDLGPRLRHFLATLSDADVFVVPGGGPTADVIRVLDQTHRLGEEAAHWLALQTLTVNAHFLAALLPDFVVSTRFDQPRVIVDMHAFARADESQPDHLAHRWEVTSDSLALRVAQVVGASTLILLKSAPCDGVEAAIAGGLVDAAFAEVLRRGNVEVQWCNLRGGRLAATRRYS